MSKNYDEIAMRIPKKAEYVGLVRLTVSGMATKIGFDIDTIEDMKVAVSEVCSKIVSLESQTIDEFYDITFQLHPDRLKALFKVSNQFAQGLFTGDSGEFAYAIISSFMDEFNVKCDGDCIITMSKGLGDCVNG